MIAAADTAGPQQLQAVLHALPPAPLQAAWNLAELEDLLDPAAPLREAAVLVGLLPRAAGWNVLLTRRTEGLRHHPGQVSFPGGRLEPGDSSAADAALREAQEEIGLERRQVRMLGWLDPLATITGFRVLPLVAEIAPGFVARPDPGEVAEVFEVPLHGLLSPASLHRQSMRVGGRVRHVLSYDEAMSPGRRIWGATASILYNLRQRLEQGGDRKSG